MLRLRPAFALLLLSLAWPVCHAQQVVLDAASVGNTGQLTLASSQSGDASTPLQLVNGSALSLAGRVRSTSPQRADVSGTTVAQLQLTGVPANLSAANYSCLFLTYQQIQTLENTALQTTGSKDISQVPTLLQQYVQEALAALTSPPLTVPLLSVNGSTNASDPAVVAEQASISGGSVAGGVDLQVSCGVPAGVDDVVPAVLWLLPSSDGSQGDAFYISRGSSVVQMTRVSVYGFSPQTGSAAGGTNITVQGMGFLSGLQCNFTNSATNYSVTVNASVISSMEAICTVPAWQDSASNASSARPDVMVTWPDDCVIGEGFGLYPGVELAAIWPKTLPRYGSWPLALELQNSLIDLPLDTVVSLQPVVRIRRGASSGSDLLLPGNLTDSPDIVVANTPAGGAPLPAGWHVVELSLNGVDFSSDDSGGQQVVLFQGPLVSMETDYIQLASGDTQVNISLQLLGDNSFPVTASLAVSQRAASGVSNAALPADLVMEEALFWDVGEYGSIKTVMVNLPQKGEADQFRQRALVVNITSASNADVDPAHSFTLVSEAPQSQLGLTFESSYNQVVYPNDTVLIPLNVTPGDIPVPGSVDWQVELLTEVEAPILPMRNGSYRGVLAWDPADGLQTAIALPVDWSQVPLWAEYRLSLILLPASNAAVIDHSDEVALHIFGVDQGTCPPGTFVKPHPGDAVPRLPTTPAAATAGLDGAAAPTPQRDARLASIRLTDAGNDAPVPLSSAFVPTTTSYGAIVSRTVQYVNMCLQPMQSAAQISVYDSTQALIPAQGEVIAATVPLNGFNTVTAGRRLRRLLLRQRHTQQAAPAQQPQHAWWRRMRRRGLLGLLSTDGGGAAAAACSGPSWRLPLAAGQNDFSAVVSSATAAAQETSGPQSFAQQQQSLAAAGNVSALYTLSIVQLTDPAHAEMQTMLATSHGITKTVCGPSANQTLTLDGSIQPGEGGNSSSESNSTALQCVPDQLMAYNVSANTTWLSLNAGLRFPNVQGIRVEVNGQVLSQGGDVAADQVTDTTTAQPTRQNPAFLPSAIIVGLDPGVPLEVPIVVTAEDGVTSLRYYVTVTRDEPEVTASSAASGANSSSSILSSLTGLGGSSNSSGYLGTSTTEAFVSRVSQLQVGASPKAAALTGSPQGAPGMVSAGVGSGAGEALFSTEPQDASQLPTGWPVPPALQPGCGACIGGWASTQANASYCTLCGPGTFAPDLRSPACAACPAGTYASSWGTSHCRHCVLGTFGPSEGSTICQMCPANFTNGADGSSSCPLVIPPGTNLAERYAVIVSFGVFFNGTALSEIARRVGVQASPYDVLSNLVRADTASAFNISVGDVNVTGVTQIARRVLYVNITANIPADVAPDASEDDVRAALNVKSLSADDPINLLAHNPDKFFGRTTKALDVRAAGDPKHVMRSTSSPHRGEPALAWPAILGIVAGGLLLLALCAATFARRRTRRLYGAVVGALSSRSAGARSGGPLSPGAATALSGTRHRTPNPDRMLQQTEYSDSAAAASP